VNDLLELNAADEDDFFKTFDGKALDNLIPEVYNELKR